MKHVLLVSLAAVLPAAYGIAFGGPEPTAEGPNRALQGISPAPTKAPSINALQKRQNNIVHPLCGWVDGDWDSALTCSASRTCMLYKSASIGMAGCCVGENRQNCGWAKSCVNYSQLTAGNCGATCLLDEFVRKCSNSASPYCMTYTYLSDDIVDYDCGSVSTIRTVRMSATDTISQITKSIKLATVAAASVTGVDAPSADTSKKAEKLAIGGIVGIVVAVIFLFFCIIIGVCICLKRKKKQKQIAANAQIIAANQANRQSQYQAQTYPQNTQQSQPLLQQHGMMRQQQPPMAGQYGSPMPSQSPQPSMPGYFSSAGQQKYDAHVQEYAMTPISNPPTPAPAYIQSYATQPNAPPIPQQAPQRVVSPVQQYQSPAEGAVEVDAISVPHAPNQTGQPGQPVYEMGQGR